jgi:hypothetical protein
MSDSKTFPLFAPSDTVSQAIANSHNQSGPIAAQFMLSTCRYLMGLETKGLIDRLEILLRDARRLKGEAETETERQGHDGLAAGYESALCEIHAWADRAGINI